MYTVFRVPKNRDPNLEEVSLSIKLFGDDAKRWTAIFKLARSNDANVEKSDVIRFLIGLPTKRGGFLKEEDRKKFLRVRPSADYPHISLRADGEQELKSRKGEK